MSVMRNMLVSKQLKYYLFLSFFLIVGLTAFAQQKISGIVLSDDNLPLSGATVNLKGSNITTLTLTDGTFTISAKKNDTLGVSFTGFKSQQIKIGNETSLK